MIRCILYYLDLFCLVTIKHQLLLLLSILIDIICTLDCTFVTLLSSTVLIVV